MLEAQCLSSHLAILRHLSDCPILSRQLHILVAHLLRHTEDVEDVLQQTWLTALRSPPAASWLGDPRNWIAVVARNLAVARHRRNLRDAGRRETPPTEPEDRREERATRREEMARHRELLHEFLGDPREEEPRGHRVLRLAAEGATNEQIAAELGITVDAVKGYRCRAMKQVRVWAAGRGEIEEDSH